MIWMRVAPESSAFSRSSFTAVARSETPCPLQIRWTTAALMRVIDDDELMRNEVMENEDF